jgi:D-alanyl-D-alanine carboxypeptidase (penicillin-binding protein 5/6)
MRVHNELCHASTITDGIHSMTSTLFHSSGDWHDRTCPFSSPDPKAAAVTQQEPSGGFEEFTSVLLGAELRIDDGPIGPEALAARRRRRRRRLIIASIAAAAVVAVISTYTSLVVSAPVAAVEPTVPHPAVALPPAAAIALPSVGESAVSISGADAYLGSSADGIFASSGGNGALPMASISKVVTALVILSAKPLGASGTGPTITFSSADAALYDKYYVLDGTIAPMTAGSSMTEHDAIETMLVVSACNYADAMADWAFGSDAGFVSAAKKWLSANGLTGTRMVEPTGIDPGNVSTPSDLITIGKLAMANPAIASIVGNTTLDVPVPALSGMPNTNDLIGTDGIDGIKTGTLDPGGSDLLFSAVVPVGTRTPLTVTGVMLGGASHGSVDSAVETLISSIKSGFHRVKLARKGEIVGSYSTPWGATANVTLARDASTLTWSNTPITSKIVTEPLATGTSGKTVGEVTWTAGTNTSTVPIVLHGTIRGPSLLWRLIHGPQLIGK